MAPVEIQGGCLGRPLNWCAGCSASAVQNPMQKRAGVCSASAVQKSHLKRGVKNKVVFCAAQYVFRPDQPLIGLNIKDSAESQLFVNHWQGLRIGN